MSGKLVALKDSKHFASNNQNTNRAHWKASGQHINTQDEHGTANHTVPLFGRTRRTWLIRFLSGMRCLHGEWQIYISQAHTSWRQIRKPIDRSMSMRECSSTLKELTKNHIKYKSGPRKLLHIIAKSTELVNIQCSWFQSLPFTGWCQYRFSFKKIQKATLD
jgi:hypothetical protein